MSIKTGKPESVGLSNYTNETFMMRRSPADDIVIGPVFFGTAGEVLTRGDIVYQSSDGKYYKAKADSSATMPAVAIAAIDMAADITDIFADITAYVGEYDWSWTVGGDLYVSAATAGAMTQTAPTGTNLVQVLGYATTTTTIKFNPEMRGFVPDFSTQQTAYTSADPWTPTPAVGTAGAKIIFTCASVDHALEFAAPTGTPTNGQELLIRLKSDATPRALTWNAAYRAGDVPLPSTTVASKTGYYSFMYNSTDSKWDYVGTIGNF